MERRTDGLLVVTIALLYAVLNIVELRCGVLPSIEVFCQVQKAQWRKLFVNDLRPFLPTPAHVRWNMDRLKVTVTNV